MEAGDASDPVLEQRTDINYFEESQGTSGTTDQLDLEGDCRQY